MMKIEIWSDVVCPFCFIGKHRMEMAMKKFPSIEFSVEWKSFQLNPDEITNPELNASEQLAARKGWSMEETSRAHQHVCTMGESCNIGFEFDKVKVVNSFDAHRLLHFAKTKGKQNLLKEELFKAHFEEGINTADFSELVLLAEKIGLSADEVNTVLHSEAFAEEVRKDLIEARELSIQGVPFFVFNRKYAVSGAQDSSVFESVIEKVLEEQK